MINKDGVLVLRHNSVSCWKEFLYHSSSTKRLLMQLSLQFTEVYKIEQSSIYSYFFVTTGAAF